MVGVDKRFNIYPVILRIEIYMPDTLIIIFSIHLLAFAVLYFRRRQKKYLLLVATFVVLIAANTLILLELDLPLPLFSFAIKISDLFNVMAILLTAVCFFVIIKSRFKKDSGSEN